MRVPVRQRPQRSRSMATASAEVPPPRPHLQLDLGRCLAGLSLATMAISVYRGSAAGLLSPTERALAIQPYPLAAPPQLHRGLEAMLAHPLMRFDLPLGLYSTMVGILALQPMPPEAAGSTPGHVALDAYRDLLHDCRDMAGALLGVQLSTLTAAAMAAAANTPRSMGTIANWIYLARMVPGLLAGKEMCTVLRGSQSAVQPFKALLNRLWTPATPGAAQDAAPLCPGHVPTAPKPAPGRRPGVGTERGAARPHQPMPAPALSPDGVRTSRADPVVVPTDAQTAAVDTLLQALDRLQKGDPKPAKGPAASTAPGGAQGAVRPERMGPERRAPAARRGHGR